VPPEGVLRTWLRHPWLVIDYQAAPHTMCTLSYACASLHREPSGSHITGPEPFSHQPKDGVMAGSPRVSAPNPSESRTLKVRGGIISQANRYLNGCCSSQRIFPPQIIQVLLEACLQARKTGRGIVVSYD